MKCANCEHNDGMVYTSIPPKYRCTITDEFHLGCDDCNVEFAPVKHGRWIETDYCDYDDTFRCSVCGNEWEFIEGTPKDNGANYCPNCGARMDAQIGEDKSHPFAESVMMGMDEVEE